MQERGYLMVSLGKGSPEMVGLKRGYMVNHKVVESKHQVHLKQ